MAAASTSARAAEKVELVLKMCSKKITMEPIGKKPAVSGDVRPNDASECAPSIGIIRTGTKGLSQPAKKPASTPA